MCEIMTVAVVDDEAEARASVGEALSRYEHEHAGVTFVIHEYQSGEALLADYRSDVDMVLLDVEMGGRDGVETARAIRDRDHDVTLVFVTNMAQYAIHGYEVNALSYLLKPLNYYAFAREMGRCVAARRARDTVETLTFSTAAGAVRVPLSNITYLECIRHKIIVHTLDGNYEFTGTLKSFVPVLEPRGFSVANSCYLVNLRYVMSVNRNSCVLRDDTQLAVSRRRRPMLMQSMASYVSMV
ncbi:response regulator transcription factor [Bifidobacterium reuteri]|uniref:Response regulator transcription factor n=1 Tax=Bifidobacterium reuteri TaxID=983706 RepID=A0A5J5E6C2_9BIFI|nr:LytTR family DNA-binding domain-containing protein [Bifidobacterium reuteri]KAA8824420.1 response regulator transcription factor [Bifidobacterium reuteri]